MHINLLQSRNMCLSGLQPQKMMMSSGKGSSHLEMSAVKMEMDDELHTGLKRKREPDEFDPLE